MDVKAVALPEWVDCIFIDVVNQVSLAQHERGAVGARELMDGAANDRCHLL